MGDNVHWLDEAIEGFGHEPAGEGTAPLAEHLIAAAALLLQQGGHADAAALLADIPSFRLLYEEKDWGIEYYTAVIQVESTDVERFTAEIKSRIQHAMDQVWFGEQLEIRDIDIRPVVPRPRSNWREELKAAQAPPVSNHARTRVRDDPKHPEEDRMHFTNKWEQGVYRILKKRQHELPDAETIGIFPLAAMRCLNFTFTPDILVTYKGNAGVIEIDGPHHKGKNADDRSRDRLMLNEGVKWVDRLDVQDTTNLEEVEKFVTDFLRRLQG